MGGVTIAHQPTSSTEVVITEDTLNFSDIVDTVDQEQLNQLLAASQQWSVENLPVVEDLTGEVEDLMMRESMSSWLQPWMNDNAVCLDDFDAHMYAQSLQIGEIFNQDQLNFTEGFAETGFYDELTFVPEDSSLSLSHTISSESSESSLSGNSAQVSPIVESATVEEENLDIEVEDEPTTLTETLESNVVDISAIDNSTLKRRRRSSASSEDDSASETDTSESEVEQNIIPTTVANMSNRHQVNYFSSSDSESDTEDTVVVGHRSRAASPLTNPYVYMHKRQIEETLLDRITNQLHPERLPGILPILSPENKRQQDDEVEIDLSCLAREQLVQVLSYVDACISEQNGGPVVHVEDYIVDKKATHFDDKATSRRNRRPASKSRHRSNKTKTKSRTEITEHIDGNTSFSDSSDSEDDKPIKQDLSEGPISMASLSKKKNTVPSISKPARSKRNSNKKSSAGHKTKSRRKKADGSVSSSVTVIQDPDSIAISRPKRRAAVHKRRLLEEMLAPSDESDGEEEDSMLVVYSDEKMDLGVVDNRTIMHNVPTALSIETSIKSVIEMKTIEDTDEEIDIML